MNILHGSKVHSVNRLVKNPKHITAMEILNIMGSVTPISQECQNYSSVSQMPDYLLVMQMSKR